MNKHTKKFFDAVEAEGEILWKETENGIRLSPSSQIREFYGDALSLLTKGELVEFEALIAGKDMSKYSVNDFMKRKWSID